MGQVKGLDFRHDPARNLEIVNLWRAALTLGRGVLARGVQMIVETIDGIRVLKLRGQGSADALDDRLALVQLWRLMAGGHELRDITPGARRFL